MRCLTPEVPVRRGWGVLLTGAAAAVAVIERARGAGLLVSGPGPDWGWGGRRLGPHPLGSLRSARPAAFGRQFSACQTAGDLRRRRGHRSRGRAPPARFATPSVHRCANVRRPEWFSTPPLHPGGRPFLRFSEWTLLGGGGAPGFQTDVPRWARVCADHPGTAVTAGVAFSNYALCTLPPPPLAGPAYLPLKPIIPAPSEGQRWQPPSS